MEAKDRMRCPFCGRAIRGCIQNNFSCREIYQDKRDEKKDYASLMMWIWILFIAALIYIITHC